MKQDFIEYQNMANGPSHFKAKFPNGEVIIRTRAGLVHDWNCNADNLIALDISEHDFSTDLYIFVLIDDITNRAYSMGWISFDELLEKSEPIFDKETIYLTIPINKLNPIEDFKKLPNVKN